jgi:hypothetical protein
MDAFPIKAIFIKDAKVWRDYDLTVDFFAL